MRSHVRVFSSTSELITDELRSTQKVISIITINI